MVCLCRCRCSRSFLISCTSRCIVRRLSFSFRSSRSSLFLRSACFCRRPETHSSTMLHLLWTYHGMNIDHGYLRTVFWGQSVNWRKRMWQDENRVLRAVFVDQGEGKWQNEKGSEVNVWNRGKECEISYGEICNKQLYNIFSSPNLA